MLKAVYGRVLALALAFSACTGASEEPSHHADASTGGSGGVGGFDPFGDGSFAGGGCDGGVDASDASDAKDEAVDDECVGVAGAGSYGKDVAPILIGCTGEVCHVSPTRSTLVGQLSHECCDGRLLVAPGHPSKSYLVDKLFGQNLCGGVRMPSGKPALADDDIGLIVRWICSGALGD